MTILINGKELQKRIIGGKEVTKVIQGGVQVRPSSGPTPPGPQPEYHVMSDFTNGSLPTGWSVSSGNVSMGGGSGGAGMSAIVDQQTGVAHAIVGYNSMPSLADASRVKIECKFYRDTSESNQFELFLYELYNSGYISGSGGSIYNSNGWMQRGFTETTRGEGRLNDIQTGEYTISTDIDLVNKTATQRVAGYTINWTLTDYIIEEIRAYNDFHIEMYNGVTIKDLDVYIWEEETPTTVEGDFTQGAMPSGWETSLGSSNFSQGGLTTTSSSSPVVVRPTTTPSMSDASKVKFIMDFNWDGTSGGGFVAAGTEFRKTVGYSMQCFVEGLNRISCIGTHISDVSYGTFNPGNQKLTLDLDLSLGTLSVSISGASTVQLTGTLDSDAIASIKDTTVFNVFTYKGIIIYDAEFYVS